MKKYFYLLPFSVLISCGNNESSVETTAEPLSETTQDIVTSKKDYFSFEIQLPDGSTLTKMMEFDSDRSVACYNRLNNDPYP